MECKNYNIKITEGNAFALLFPLKQRTFVSREPIDTDIDILDLTDVVVKVGGVAYPAEQQQEGLLIRDGGTLARGTYNIEITATYYDNAIRAAYFEALTIVSWNEQSDAQQYIQGSPIVMPAAYCVYSLTDAELEALKEDYREKNAQLDQAIEDAEEAKREWEEKAADLDGVAQEETLTQGVQDIRDDISHIDIDTSTLAKETSVKDGNDTAIGVIKSVNSEQGTSSDTAAETGTLFAVVKWVKDKVKSIFNYIGTPASGQPSTLFAAIAAGGGGGGDAQESTSLAILAKVNEIVNAHIVQNVSVGGFTFVSGVKPDATVFSIMSYYNSITHIEDDETVNVGTNFPNSLGNLKYIRLSKALKTPSLYSDSALTEAHFPSAIQLMNVQTGSGNTLKILDIRKCYINPNGAQGASSVVDFGSYNKNLIDIIWGENATISLRYLALWNPTYALDPTSSSLVDAGETFANNLEKLLYNIREHIAAFLPDLTGQTSQALTFHANIKSAIQADTATSNAFTNKNWTIT